MFNPSRCQSQTTGAKISRGAVVANSCRKSGHIKARDEVVIFAAVFNLPGTIRQQHRQLELGVGEGDGLGKGLGGGEGAGAGGTLRGGPTPFFS